MKIYRGWLKSGIDHMLFETMADNLKVGDIITDFTGKQWIIDVIF